MQYLVVLEETDTGYSAYSPDLAGCVATGGTRHEVERNMREAIELHIEALRKQGVPLPQRKAYSTYMDIPA